MPLSGKSTLAHFLAQHIKDVILKPTDDDEDLISILSTDQVLNVMGYHITKEEEPIIHKPFYDVQDKDEQ